MPYAPVILPLCYDGEAAGVGASGVQEPAMTSRDSQPPEDTRQLHRAYRSKNVGELAEFYDQWSQDYEQHMCNVGYMHPAMVSSMVGRHVDIGVGPILDAGAGTGIIGEILTAMGQDEIVGLDASEGMLELAAKKGFYSELHRMFLGERLDFADDRFEAVVSAGVFTDGHAPLDGLDELLRVTRPGGRLVFSVARGYLDGPFDDKRGALEADGAWKPVDRTEVYNSAPLGDELFSRVFVYETC
jgi:SAM-dependent methyltransferase